MFAIVIDKHGFKVEFVHIFENGTIDSYILKEDEILIYDNWQVANSMNKPQWNGTEWIDTDPLPPVEPEPQPPNEIEICMAKIAEQEEQIMLQEETTLDIDYRVTCIELGI